jgi:RNA polymerase sigma-70 factor (ECF subfamily)
VTRAMHAAHAYDDYANDDLRSDGRDAAFAVFFQRFHPRLLAYARRAWGERDAEEITQETFFRAYESVDLTRGWRNQWGWLLVVARNIAGDMARSRRYCEVPEQGEALPMESSIASQDVEADLLDNECLSVFGSALSTLPPSQSRAWWLTVAEGMSPTAIATSLDCSPESVRQALFKSRKRLAGTLAEFCGRASALVAPAFVTLRRVLRKGAGQAAKPAGNAMLAAAMSSSVMVGAIAVLNSTGGAAPQVAPAAAFSSSVLTTDSRSVRLDRHAAPAGHTHGAAPVSSVPTLTAPLPVRHGAYVSKTPLKSGRVSDTWVILDTPIGPIANSNQLDHHAGPLCTGPQRGPC